MATVMGAPPLTLTLVTPPVTLLPARNQAVPLNTIRSLRSVS